MSHPLVSVVLPTYRRPEMVQRAIESVFRQTIAEWELVVSDDEEPAGETWDVLQRLAATDVRVRPVQNRHHGMIQNWNNVMAHATAPWLKILHSDDALVPTCLETMLDAAERSESAVLLSCLVSDYRGGRPHRTERAGRKKRFELVPSRYALLGMYLQEAGPGPPSLVMVRRSIVTDRNVHFREVPGFVSAMDVDWSMRVLSHGDLLMVNEPLVERHHGSHTTTSTISEQQIDKEVEMLRHHYLAYLDPTLSRPSLETMVGAIRLIRAANRFKKRRFAEAASLALSVRRPRSWLIAGRWVLQMVFPGRFRTLPYVPLDSS